jgi:hypothetical protein
MKIIDDTKYEWMMEMIDRVPKDRRLELEYRPSIKEIIDRWNDVAGCNVSEFQIAILVLERFRDFVLSSCKDKDSVIGNLDLWIDKYKTEFNELNEEEED